jgi:tetratricopeptide (TPR) repeat protein
MHRLREVTALIEERRLSEALKVLDSYMFDHPDDPKGKFMFGHIMMESEKPAIAYMAFKQVIEADPKRSQAWNNYGKALDDLLRYKDAEKAFQRAHRLEDNLLARENLSTNAVHQCNPDRAIHWAKKALEMDPDSRPAHVNLGFSYLMKRDFSRGWEEYEWGLGKIKWRDERNYNDEPRWDGSKGKNLVIYGEQGLGDQIAFAAPINDAKKDCKRVIVDTHPKLKNLFARSFGVETHGDMFETTLEWPDQSINANCSLASLQKHYRNDISQFSGLPFLTPDPERVIQWRALLGSLGDKPKIGIAWTGGISETLESERSTTLEALIPLLRQDVTWISLEYKDRSAEIASLRRDHGIVVHDYPWATQTGDYDDTAALVNELDLVISVPTSVVHLAGGLGVPCWCLLHPKPHFLFGLEGDSMPFYKSVELFRRRKGWDILETVSEKLNEFRRHHPGRTGARRDTQASGGVCQNRLAAQGSVFAH